MAFAKALSAWTAQRYAVFSRCRLFSLGVFWYSPKCIQNSSDKSVSFQDLKSPEQVMVSDFSWSSSCHSVFWQSSQMQRSFMMVLQGLSQMIQVSIIALAFVFIRAIVFWCIYVDVCIIILTNLYDYAILSITYFA